MKFLGGPLELSISLLESPQIADAHVQLGFSEWSVRWTASGRGGLALILDQWRDKFVDGHLLLPDYLCWDAILPLLEGLNVQYVSVGDQLVPEIESLAKALDDPELRAVFLIDYFGLCDLHPQLELIKLQRPDVLVAIDAVQAFLALSDAKKRYPGADAIASSPRKVLPIPDGGLVLMANLETMPILSCTAGSAERDALYLAAGTLREAVVNGRLDEEASMVAETLYVELFNRHKGLISPLIESMSPLSTEILRRTDLTRVANQRSANIAWLQQALRKGRGGSFLRAALPAGKGPGLALPIRVAPEHRDPLRAHLRANGYFCPVHWPVPAEADSILGPVARCLAGELLSLPVDQRYDEGDLDQMVKEIERYGEICKQ
jgi:dTDP-4-amino-4,6-dideoxygalactose transaminase